MNLQFNWVQIRDSIWRVDSNSAREMLCCEDVVWCNNCTSAPEQIIQFNNSVYKGDPVQLSLNWIFRSDQFRSNQSNVSTLDLLDFNWISKSGINLGHWKLLMLANTRGNYSTAFLGGCCIDRNIPQASRTFSSHLNSGLSLCN